VKVQQKILTLCEAWWLYNGARRETLILNVLPILVQAALDGKDDDNTFETTTLSSSTSSSTKITSMITKPAAIKRLFQIRTAIDELDFNDPGSASFCALLLRLVSSPSCLNTIDGRKLLSYLLNADVTLMQRLHQSIRAQIPNNRPTILKAYSEIYFRAWNDVHLSADDDGSSGDGNNDDDDDASNSISNTIHSNMRSKFENHVLQDLMYSSIHASNPVMVKSLMRLLQAFYDAKKDRNVEAMFYRMYSPILWRSLTATNAIVRVNAAMVFSEVFPLQNPNHLQTDQAILKGCQSMQHLLCDRDPRVRVAGSECVAKILSTYWEVIPPVEIRSLLNRKYL
jgi:condensin-2 complex subunit G2